MKTATNCTVHHVLHPYIMMRALVSNDHGKSATSIGISLCLTNNISGYIAADLKEKRKKHEQRLLEKAAKSRLIQDLVAEYDDRPEQQGVEGGARDGYGGEDALDAREKERTQYEEDNFTRLTLSKKEARRVRDGGLNRFTDEFKVCGT